MPFCGDTGEVCDTSKQWMVVSHSLQVTTYGISGFGDSGMWVQHSSYMLFIVCQLKSDPLMLFCHLLTFLTKQFQFLWK